MGNHMRTDKGDGLLFGLGDDRATTRPRPNSRQRAKPLTTPSRRTTVHSDTGKSRLEDRPAISAVGQSIERHNRLNVFGEHRQCMIRPVRHPGSDAIVLEHSCTR